MREIIKEHHFTTIGFPIVFIVAITIAQYFKGYLLFHTLAELFTILVGFMMFGVCYFTYHFTKNNFLLFLGIGYFWIAMIDFFHMLTYSGMLIYPLKNIDITLTFWILSRFFEAMLLLSAPFISFTLISKRGIFILFGSLFGFVYWLSFSRYIPSLYVENVGLTSLKIGAEYTIIFLLSIALFIYVKYKKSLDKSVYSYIFISILLTICSELAFTFYVDFYGYTIMLGHLFKVLSYWLIFLAIVKTSLQTPFMLMTQESSTYDAIPVSAIVVDSQGVIRQINQATKNFLKLTQDEIINHSNHMLFHDKNIKESECEICKVIQDGKKLSSYELYKESQVCSFTISPLHLADELEGAIQVCIDISEKKGTESKLRSETTLLKTIINTIPVRIFWKDRNSLYLGCNKLFAQDAGISDEKEIIGKSDHDMPWINEAQNYIDDDKKIMASKIGKTDYEELQTLKNAATQWINTSKAPLLNEDGTVAGILGAYFEITERKKAEEKLLTTVKLLENTERIGHIGSWEFDLQTQEFLWSDEVFIIHGEKVNSFKPTLEIALSYVSKENQYKLKKNISLVKSKKETGVIHYDILRRDATIRNVFLKNEIVLSKSGIATKVVGIIYDETEQLASEQELKKLQVAIEQSPVSIIITDNQGNIEYVNPQFTKISGYTFKEVIGKNPRILASGLISKDEYTQLWNKITNNEIWTGVFKNIKKSGEGYWESGIISPIKNKDGEIINYIGIQQDISEKMALENLLKDQEQLMVMQSRHAAMGEMIGMIAHQWRQPLSVVSMGANNMLLDMAMGNVDIAAFKNEADSILKQVNHLSQTIEDFRNFFRPDKEKESVDIKNIIQETLNIIGKSLENNEVEVNLSFSSSPYIETYRRELIQVLINILNNAKEAMNEKCTDKKSLFINVKEEEKSVIIEICDNGGGINEYIINKIFDPYFTTKSKQIGTGLGLYMSKTIVNKHLNGQIIAKNNNIGGVCLIVSLPK